jgi:hypothetical protein
MLDGIGGNRPTARQHLLDQIDAAARTLEFVTEQDIGRAGSGPEPAMRAIPQHLLGCRNVGVGELLRREISPHGLSPTRSSLDGCAR